MITNDVFDEIEGGQRGQTAVRRLLMPAGETTDHRQPRALAPVCALAIHKPIHALAFQTFWPRSCTRALIRNDFSLGAVVGTFFALP